MEERTPNRISSALPAHVTPPRAAGPFRPSSSPPPPTPPALLPLLQVAPGTRLSTAGDLRRLDRCRLHPRASVSSAGAGAPPPMFLPRSSSGSAPSTGCRGYPRLPTPARASFCPYVVDDAASCSSIDTSSTLTDCSKPDGIPVVDAPSKSLPLLCPASCHGRRLSLSRDEEGGGRWPEKGYREGGRAPVAAAGHRYVQYRLLNARGAEAVRAKAATAENSLVRLAERIAGLRESITDKRVEDEKIKRDQRFCSTVGGQDVSMQELSEERTHYLVKSSIGCPRKKEFCGGYSDTAPRASTIW